MKIKDIKNHLIFYNKNIEYKIFVSSREVYIKTLGTLDAKIKLIKDNYYKKGILKMSKNVYRVDHKYFNDHNESCLIIETDMELDNIVKVLVALEFKFEDLNNPEEFLEFEDIFYILDKIYKVKNVKNDWLEVINELSMESYDRGSEYGNYDLSVPCCVYPFKVDKKELLLIDMYIARESHCGKDYKNVYKFLGDNIDEIESFMSKSTNERKGVMMDFYKTKN